MEKSGSVPYFTAWDRLATLDAHKQWSQDLEPFVVSGSPRWEVLRVVG